MRKLDPPTAQVTRPAVWHAPVIIDVTHAIAIAIAMHARHFDELQYYYLSEYRENGWTYFAVYSVRTRLDVRTAGELRQNSRAHGHGGG